MHLMLVSSVHLFHFFLIHHFFLKLFTYPMTRNSSLCDFCADTKRFKKDLRVVHVRDLNFILKSEIFVHWDGQLRASHLILGLKPVYST